MEKKRLTKYVWWGSDVDKNGNPILPGAASAENHLDGLNVGEIFIHVASGSATLWTATPEGKIVQLSGADIDKLYELFLSKTKDDKTEHSLSIGKDLKVGGNLGSTNFVQGNTMGAGWSVYRDGNGNFVVETDRMVIRKDMTVNELIVNQETFNKGSIIYVKAGCTITRVEEHENFYRCYYDNQDNGRYSGFVVGDQARCQRYDQSYKDLVKYYWRLVIGVGDDFVDLSKTDKDGSGVPEEGDDIAQLGNRTNKTRQSAIVISPDNGGSVVVWAGIDSFELSNKNMVGMGVNNNTGRAYLYGYGDMYFGDRNLEGNFITYQIKDGDTKPTLKINADVHLGKGSTGLSNLSEFKSVEDEIQHIQENVNILGVDVGIIKEQNDREFTIWYFDPIPTLENEPAINWNTDELKKLHDQDIYFSDTLARAWRFVNGEWIEITDERTLAVLKMAEAAESAAQEALDASIEVKSYIENVLPSELADLQKQIDGQIESYFYKYDPTLENKPASLWVTDEQKASHLNDTFTNLDNGYSWRWTVDNEVYGWTEIADTATSKALLAAGQAQDTADGKRRVFVNTPYPPYDEGDLWVQGSSGDILRCSTPKGKDGNYEESDWVKASKYTDDTALNDFINVDYKKQLDKINQQIDERAETWYQEEDPSLAWDTEELKQLHVGDLWYSINDKQSFMWTGSEWIPQGVPKEVFDTIDGKSSIYTSKPSSYNKNDLWILAEDTTLDAVYKAGTIVIAMESSEVFVKEHWTKKDSYTDDTEADKANARLESWASDGSISPTEKTALKQQKLDIQGEYNSLLISAVTYGIDIESFSEAYELAIAALAKYTASTPENITIGYDYQHIEAYYQARQELRASIDAAIKMESDKAYKEAVEAKGDAKTIKEDVDGIQADMDIIKEQTDKEYVIWYFDHEPTLQNEPAIHWTTDELIKMHDQDLFFSDATGNAWRFVKGQWEPITDERTIVALREAKEAKQGVADLGYLKDAMKDYTTKIEGGLLMTSLVAVQNDNEEVEAFLNGSDFAKNDTHGKLLLAGGIPDGDNSIEERARNAATKFYEDGHIVSRSAEIEGKIVVGILGHNVLTEPSGDLTGYSMAIPPQGANGVFTLPDISDGGSVEIKVIWLQISMVATYYSVETGNASVYIMAQGNDGMIQYLSAVVIEPNTLYKFISGGGHWFVSTEKLLTV